MHDIFVNLNSVSRIYSRGTTSVTALDNVTCSVKSKDRIAVVGASGSGKSTLLHIMGGLDSPTFGEVSWPSFDKSISLRPNYIGFVLQMQSLMPTLSIIENVELPLLLMNRQKDEARIAAMESLKHLELANLADKLPDELSGGQMQRAAMARVLSTKPKLILADEPTGQLDHLSAKNLLDELLSCIDGLDTAVVIATHDMAIADRMNLFWQIEHGVLGVKNK